MPPRCRRGGSVRLWQPWSTNNETAHQNRWRTRQRHRGDERIGIAGAGFVAGKLLDSDDETIGFNAQTEVYENLVQAGVIDPTKVVRTALQDAASVAGLLITTEAAVSEAPEDKPAGGGMPGGGMGGMGGMDF